MGWVKVGGCGVAWWRGPREALVGQLGSAVGGIRWVRGGGIRGRRWLAGVRGRCDSVDWICCHAGVCGGVYMKNMHETITREKMA